ncbi:MAG: hypothetical protein WC982_03820 [Advenella sp.]
MKLAILAAIMAPVFLAGCASTPSSYTYNNQKSMALNLANAGGIRTGISDTDMPKDSTGTLATSIPYGVAFTASGFASPALGFTSFGGGAMSLLSFLTTPKAQSARNSIMAFMPDDFAVSDEDARKKLFDMYYQNAGIVIKSLGGEPHIFPDEEMIKHTKNLTFRRALIQNPDWNCPIYSANIPKESKCWLLIDIKKPILLNYPNFVTSNPKYYRFGAESSDYNQIKFEKPTNAKIPEYEILSALSKSLPDWTYMYIAPKQVSNQSGDKMNFPFILRTGNTELFLSPE